MEIKEIRKNTYCIDTGRIDIPFYRINEKEIIVLDAGWNESERPELEALLDQNGFLIVGLICTHARIESTGTHSWLKEKYGCTIAMAEYEALISSSAVNLKAYLGERSLADVESKYGCMLCNTDILISAEEDSVLICGIRFGILHTPGHSPAHLCVVTPDDVAYLGDCLISEELMQTAKLPNVFILREDLKSKELLYGLSCVKYVLAHKGVFDDITQLITDNLLFYTGVAERVLSVIDDRMTMDEIMKAAVTKLEISVNTVDKYAEIRRTLKAYVEYLYETGRIQLELTEGFLKYSNC